MTATPHPDTPGIINNLRNEVQNPGDPRNFVPHLQNEPQPCAECGAAHEPAAPHVSCPLCDHVHPAPTRNDWFRAHAGGAVDRRVHPEHIACPTCGEYHTNTQRHGQCSTCGEAHPQGTPHPTANRECPHCGDFAEHGADDRTANAYHANDWDDWDEYDHDSPTPRTEPELVDSEPNRVAGIRNRLNAVLKMHDSRVHDSNYFVRQIPGGTYRRQDDDEHVVLAYHKNDPETAIGHLTYNNQGEVGGMYLDHRHQKGLAAVQMLVAAHRHLKDTIGNPIGLLKSGQTTTDSAGLIRKIDPDSTYLRQPGANSGTSHDTQISHTNFFSGVPVSPNSLIRPEHETRELAAKHGYSVSEALAMSYDPENREQARNPWFPPEGPRFQDMSPEVRAVHDRLEAAHTGARLFRQQQKVEKAKTELYDRLGQRVARHPGDLPIEGLGPRDLDEPIFHSMDRSGLRRLMDVGTTLPNDARSLRENFQAQQRRKIDTEMYTTEAAHDNQDLVGTAGVWTGDDEIEDKKSPSRAEVEEKRTGLVPLDLNPMERVRRITQVGQYGETTAYRRAED